MANPRKFAEKIALLNQKQAEGNAQFEQVMKEVSDATKRVNPLPKQHLRITQTLGSFRGGSLPNVNHVANSTVEVKTDQPIPGTLDELKKSGRGDGTVPYRERGRSVGVGPMRSRPVEKRIDTSPYSGAYLSPPPDSSWRRTNSDSALHHSAMCGDGSPRRSHDNGQADVRSRNCYDGTIPGINVYPSQHEPGSLQIPISNNTGSLPDLTCFHFPSPLPTPLDQDADNTSPQGSSPQSGSSGRFTFNNRSQEIRVPSPHAQVDINEMTEVQNAPPQVKPLTLAQLQRRRFYPQQNHQNLIPGGPQSPPQTDDGIFNHYSVPPFTSSSFLHHNKVVTQDHSLADNFTFQNSPLSPSRVSCSLSPQPDLSSQNNQSSYRSPQPSRPSPQNSPALTVNYRSASPGDSHHSAPPSPISPASSPGNHHFSSDANYLQAQLLQQHFEQFNMDWCQLVHSLVESGSSWSAHLQMDAPTTFTYITSPTSTTSTQVMSPEDAGGHELGSDAGYFSTSPHFGKPSSTQQTTPQTPNTPNSIPNIILTDFSSTPDELTKHDLVKDLSSSMGASFDTDLFPSDESLREGLGSIDFDGFQMLTDPGMVISDPSAEDHFRLDRL